jgi:hypothetical protein
MVEAGVERLFVTEDQQRLGHRAHRAFFVAVAQQFGHAFYLGPEQVRDLTKFTHFAGGAPCAEFRRGIG